MSALLLIRASLLLGAALAGATLLRRGSATTRHAVWTMAFAALLSLPALSYVLPAVPVPVPAGWRILPEGGSYRLDGGGPRAASATASTGRAAEHAPADATLRVLSTDNVPAGHGHPLVSAELEAAPAWLPSLRAAVTAIWIAGALAALVSLIVSLLRVRSLYRSATELQDAGWREAADAVAARLGCARPALRLSDAVAAPMAGGVFRPAIFLPLSAVEWPADRRDIVLAHETAHLARRDPLRHIAARLALAVYWFHPLAWIAAGRASAAREQACDEAVLALGTRPSTYARILLDFSESRTAPGLSAAALPIVEPSLLETRLMAILAHDARFSAGRRPIAAVAAVALFALGVAAANPAAITPASVGANAAPIELPEAQQQPAAQAAAAAADARCSAIPRESFHGSITTSQLDGRPAVYDMIGTRGPDRIVLRTFGDLRVCLVAEDAAGGVAGVKPSEWPGRARRSILESVGAGSTQRLEITREGASQRVRFLHGGAERPFDAAAQAWRDQMMKVLDGSWEQSSIRGEESRLRGEIAALRGEESSMRGEISALRGHASSLRGELSSVHGEESSLRGEMSSIQGHASSLEGQISSERGSISALNASRHDASESDRARIAARIREHEQEIARLEKEIRDYGAETKTATVNMKLAALNALQTIEKVDVEIRSADTEGKIQEIEKRIRALDVDGRTAAIEKRIAALNVDRRSAELQERITRDVRQLQEAIARIR